MKKFPSSLIAIVPFNESASGSGIFAMLTPSGITKFFLAAYIPILNLISLPLVFLLYATQIFTKHISLKVNSMKVKFIKLTT